MTDIEKSTAIMIMNEAYRQYRLSQQCVNFVKNRLDVELGGVWQCILIKSNPRFTSTSPIKEFEFVFGNMDHIPNMRMKCIRTA